MNRLKFEFRSRNEIKAHEGPPPLPSPLRGGCVLRYQAQVAVTNDVITNECLAALQFVATTTTAGTPIMGAVKLRKVEAWAPALVGDSSYPLNTMLTVYSGADGGEEISSKRTRSAIVGNAHGAYVSMDFPEDKYLAGKWMNSEVVLFGSDQRSLFAITAPKGTIIDLHFSYQLAVESDMAGVSVTGTGFTVGRLYHNYLDNSAYASGAGTQQLMPIGPPSSKVTAAYST